MTRGIRPAEPEPRALARSAELEARIRDEIEAAGGVLGFERFMELALYAPGLGYYSAAGDPFGAGGDFVTAPELSPLFARCLARPVADALAELGEGDVLEVGAGSGALAAELLPALAAAATTPRRYCILERSATLRAVQRARLGERVAGIPVRWLDDLPAPGFAGVVVANELLDALAVSRFRRTRDGVRECCVRWADGRFEWTLGPARPALQTLVDGIEGDLGEPLPEGYEGEAGEAGPAWVRSLAERMKRGLAILVDYGYPRRELYHPQRVTGTLACHYRHRRHDDPLARVGLQDISAHVDFTALAEAAAGAGLEVVGFTTQAEFLLSCGLLDHLADREPGTVDHLRLTAQVKRLTLPGEMGEVVKVMALGRGLGRRPPGFDGRDLRGRLGCGGRV